MFLYIKIWLGLLLAAVLYFYLFDSSFNAKLIVGVIFLLTNPINIFFNSRKRRIENPWL